MHDNSSEDATRTDTFPRQSVRTWPGHMPTHFIYQTFARAHTETTAQIHTNAKTSAISDRRQCQQTTARLAVKARTPGTAITTTVFGCAEPTAAMMACTSARIRLWCEFGSLSAGVSVSVSVGVGVGINVNISINIRVDSLPCPSGS